jgi:hypothetical protein
MITPILFYSFVVLLRFATVFYLYRNLLRRCQFITCAVLFVSLSTFARSNGSSADIKNSTKFTPLGNTTTTIHDAQVQFTR